MIGVVLRAVTSLVAPPLCAVCGDACEQQDRLCRGCDRELGRLRPDRSLLPGGLEVISAAPYDGIARRIVTRMKFGARLTLAEVAAERMVRAWGATRSGRLVPVPPAPARARARGYDTAYVLARLVALEAERSQVRACLSRDDGPRQVGRPRADRLADPPRIGIVGRGVNIPDDVWLVDDVATTGATLGGCAAILREAGATRVRALTFARADSLGPRARAA